MKSYEHIIEVADRLTASRVARWTCGYRVALISPVDCAALMGFPWWDAIVSNLNMPSFIDCGDSASLAAMALRKGYFGVIFQGNTAQRKTLSSLATLQDAVIATHRPPSLSLNSDFSERYQQHLMTNYLRDIASRKDANHE